MDIAGQKFSVDFGLANAELHFISDTKMTFIIKEKDGQPAAITETVEIKMTKLRPKLFMVTWKEKSGTTVTQVQDFENETVHSNWTTADGEFNRRQGNLKRIQ